jgi:glycosyltransferase involved in cell wall biosynthesis
MTDQLTVCIPTKDSADVLNGTLTHLEVAVDAAPVTLSKLVIVDDESADGTVPIVCEYANAACWETEAIVEPSTLPQARERAIDAVDTEWFLFLDDDVRLSEVYLAHQAEWMDCDRVGAVQGRKTSRTEPAADWIRRRSRRGGTHATLFRTAVADDVEFPRELRVLEDEYLRQYVEAQGYRWVFEPEARFEHDCQERHPIGWEEGYLGGKYGLSAFHDVALNVPFAAATGRNPLPHAKRALGWIAGSVLDNHGPGKGVPNETTPTVTESDSETGSSEDPKEVPA